jgi:hypothetical protein
LHPAPDREPSSATVRSAAGTGTAPRTFLRLKRSLGRTRATASRTLWLQKRPSPWRRADTTRRRPRPSVHRPRRRSTQLRSLALTHGDCRTMFFKPLAYPSTLDHRKSSVLRGGALEPEPRIRRRNLQANAHAYSQRNFTGRSTEGLSLSGGASIRSTACSS